MHERTVASRRTCEDTHLALSVLPAIRAESDCLVADKSGDELRTGLQEGAG